jgi:sorting nexin-41/42
VKTAEHSNTTYIAYVIKTGVWTVRCRLPQTLITRLQNFEARRRYSEFESLRNGLTKLYPTLIVPPIPSKQTIGDYAVKQGKAKEDVAMIARRKRMLQMFLNRIARHPILSHEQVFHKFLDGDSSWVVAFPSHFLSSY